MLQLTPLDKTVAGQELIQMGRLEGQQEGELIGKIQMAQQFLRQPVTSKKKLLRKSIRELEAMLQKLKSALTS